MLILDFRGRAVVGQVERLIYLVGLCLRHLDQPHRRLGVNLGRCIVDRCDELRVSRVSWRALRRARVDRIDEPLHFVFHF